jgi:uncharacterized protein
MMRSLLTKYQVSCLLPGLLLLLVVTQSYGGPPLTDFELLTRSHAGNTHVHAVSKPAFIRFEGKSPLVRYNPVTLTLSGLMFIYQRAISPQLPSSCLYEHSCSQFSMQLISRYGITKGVFTTADRLMRCNRVAATDIHPMSVNESSLKLIESVEIYTIRP